MALYSLVSNPLKDSSIIGKAKKTLEQDSLVKNVKRQINKGTREDFEFKDGLLFYQGLYISKD